MSIREETLPSKIYMLAHLAPGAGTPQETQKWDDKMMGSVPNGTSYFTSSSNW